MILYSVQRFAELVPSFEVTRHVKGDVGVAYHDQNDRKRERDQGIEQNVVPEINVRNRDSISIKDKLANYRAYHMLGKKKSVLSAVAQIWSAAAFTRTKQSAAAAWNTCNLIALHSASDYRRRFKVAI